uniref:Uncharacterized protein n=1 Tax=Alexandrium catenella TaxID=2925 RepID=A0A7S1WRA0_ALECA
MSASAGVEPAAPRITVTPPQSFAEPSPAPVPTTPSEAKIHEAQSLLADMLTPTPTGRSRGRASRRQSVPPSHGSLMPKAARGSRRALSIEPEAATDALQALNGRMPSFPSVGPRAAERAEPPGPLPWEPAPSAKLPPAG